MGCETGPPLKQYIFGYMFLYYISMDIYSILKTKKFLNLKKGSRD